MRRSLVLTVCYGVVVSVVGRAQEDPGRLVTLHGTVIDTSLRPVPGVLVYLSLARIFSLSDDNGKFTLAEVEPGEDTLQVRGRGFTPRSFRLFVPDSVHGTIDLGNVKLHPGMPPTLALTATVYDTLQDQPVAGAQVMVNDSVVGETDTTGLYSATEIPIDWGINVVLVRRVGYSPLFRTFWVGELNAQRSLTGVMQQQAVDLPAVIVEADRIIYSYGRMREFWRRRERGVGRFFTRTDIERRNPIRVTDMLRTIAGISVYRVGPTTQIRSSRSGGRCGPSIWIDGMQLSDSDLDLFVHPQDVEAIEVYRGFIETPPQFSGGFNACGAIVIWTR
jgi:hypothetical protein